MRLLVLCFALLSSGLMVAQNNSIEVYPWNPDANNDNAIGATDILSTLAVYGNEFGTPPEPCTYDGTPFEDWIFGVAEGTIICDSIWFEFELEDVSQFYSPGCPDPILDTLIFADFGMLYPAGSMTCSFGVPTLFSFIGTGAFGYTNNFGFYFNSVTGAYIPGLDAGALWELGFAEDGFFGQSNTCVWTSNFELPLPESWILDADGLHISYDWPSSKWPAYANYLHILPYWHYAD